MQAERLPSQEHPLKKTGRLYVQNDTLSHLQQRQKQQQQQQTRWTAGYSSQRLGTSSNPVPGFLAGSHCQNPADLDYTHKSSFARLEAASHMSCGTS